VVHRGAIMPANKFWIGFGPRVSDAIPNHLHIRNLRRPCRARLQEGIGRINDILDCFLDERVLAPLSRFALCPRDIFEVRERLKSAASTRDEEHWWSSVGVGGTACQPDGNTFYNFLEVIEESHHD
jgi:hypothetical protein